MGNQQPTIVGSTTSPSWRSIKWYETENRGPSSAEDIVCSHAKVWALRVEINDFY